MHVAGQTEIAALFQASPVILRCMALTQQLARVSLRYLEVCREAARISPVGDPQWDPPADDTLDLDWAIWELLWFYRRMQPDARQIPVLQRAISGDSDSTVSFLNHSAVYDGFDAPPTLLTPAAVSQVAGELATMNIGPLLETLPAYREAGGFSRFIGDPRTYLVDHFTLLRRFYSAASKREMAVVTWVD
ncbi:hypothetical protein SAMN05216252_13356 [Actinacidiphila glaucinigra]|uniref:DUF1877 domain-containing protein n=2 Tax=Actinacidiphila glaucinigra TaxID=235986 RepID=A0A239NAD6_9ACTN|nr:hypothetical protein SAMN05216252_13356 [Actinacidiphila glaucinigra]